MTRSDFFHILILIMLGLVAGFGKHIGIHAGMGFLVLALRLKVTVVMNLRIVGHLSIGAVKYRKEKNLTIFAERQHVQIRGILRPLRILKIVNAGIWEAMHNGRELIVLKVIHIQEIIYIVSRRAKVIQTVFAFAANVIE